jgi:hypothetical protein
MIVQFGTVPTKVILGEQWRQGWVMFFIGSAAWWRRRLS